MSVQHIANQRGAFEAALGLAKAHPGLPTVYTTVHTSGSLVDFRLDTLSGWEAWRDALGIDPAEVQVTTLGTHDLLLSIDAMASGVALHVYVIDQIRSVVREQAEEQARIAREQVSREDTYTSLLRHDYATPHDLPEFPAQRDRRHV